MPLQNEYYKLVEMAFNNGQTQIPEALEAARHQVETSTALFGYSPSSWFIYFGAVCAFLYARTGDQAYAGLARDALLYYRDWMDGLPSNAAGSRVEYFNGIPPIEPVFQPVVFIPVVQRIRDTLSASDLEILVGIAADGLRPIWLFPEWGGHNRAVLRAAGLALAAQAFPDHAEAPGWALLADELAEESWGRWSIEDAMLYQPHWLRALIIYAQSREKEAMFVDFLQPRMYLKAMTQLISPLGVLPDFGDSHWLMHSHWEWMACLEWGAKVYRDPAMKWTAQRIYEMRKGNDVDLHTGSVALLSWEWCDDSVPERPPLNHDDALDDLVHKKIIWRTGWHPEAAYACLNYRDEGDYGRISRDYLRQNLAVSAEKAHHGHADEGSFSMLVHDGSLLLHESGYRESPPDGEYRAAVYHNRLVWRTGRRQDSQSLLPFLRGDGSYHPVRTQRLYQTKLGDMTYHRVRTEDSTAGVVWDRSVVFLADLPCWVVLDGVQSTRTAYRTLSALWWTSHLLDQGDSWYDSHIKAIQDWENTKKAALWVGYPEIPNQSGYCSIEPSRRSFQDELALTHTWAGEHRRGQFVHFASILWPHRYDEHLPDRIKAFTVLPSEPAGRGLAVKFTWRGENRLVGILSDLDCGVGQEDVRPMYTTEKGMTRYGELAGDGALVALKEASNDSWAGFINGTHLSLGSKVLYQGKEHGMFQEDCTSRPGVPKRFRWVSKL